MTERFSGGVVGPVTSEQEGSDSSTAPLGAEKLQFFCHHLQLEILGRGLKTNLLAAHNPASASQLRLTLLRTSDSTFPSLWIQNLRTGVCPPQKKNNTFDPETLAAPRHFVHYTKGHNGTKINLWKQKCFLGFLSLFFKFIYKDLTRNSRKSDVNNRKWPKDLERRVIKWIIFTPPGITGKLSCFGHAEASAV